MRLFGWTVFLLVSCGQDSLEETALVMEGRRLFQDTKFSTNGTSCETCHPNGGMDNRRWHFPAIHDTTMGVPDSFRTLTLWGIQETGPPFLWDASRTNLAQVTRLYTDTIMGGGATQDEIEALVAYQRSLVFPRNPWRGGSLTPAQERGKILYETKAFCSPCHPAPTGTNRKAKDIGTGGVFKTPGLQHTFAGWPYFHDGRARTLDDVIFFYVSDTAGVLRAGGFPIRLSESERVDLIEYLKTL